MLRRGVELNDPLAARYDGKATGSGNCGGFALCRTCAVSVVRGGELLSRPKTNESKMIERDGGDRRRPHEVELQELGGVRDEGGRNSDTGESEAVGQRRCMKMNGTSMIATSNKTIRKKLICLEHK
jgi:hypothetical protein